MLTSFIYKHLGFNTASRIIVCLILFVLITWALSVTVFPDVEDYILGPGGDVLDHSQVEE